MKSSKLWRVIWIVGIYALLILVLYLVVLYKVQWEDKDLNTYLYFYDCNNNLCTSIKKQDNYYNKVMCKDGICPDIADIVGSNIILKREGVSWIYNYASGEVVNDKYSNYRYIGHNMFVVTDSNNKQGVIDISGNVLVAPKYEYIDDYKNELVSYVMNGLYGVDNNDEIYSVNPQYQDLVLINDKIFAGMKDNLYHLYSYSDITNDNANKYNFVYSYDDIIFVTNNKKIDILDTNLNSMLVMKIDTFYEYTTEKERDTLDIYSDGKNIYFRVFIDEFNYIDYEYNIVNKKLNK